MKVLILLFSIIPQLILVAAGSNDTTETDNSIYLQREAMFSSPHIVQGSKKIPIGRNYENLLPILENVPDAYKEASDGIALLKKGKCYSKVFSILFLFNQVFLEQMMERGKDKYLVPVNVAWWSGMLFSVYNGSKNNRIGLNRINKAIWMYNKEVN